MKEQTSIFEIVECKKEWEKEWKDMPAWERIDNAPFQQIIVSFRTWKDVQIFAELIQQRVTQHTKSLWFPPYTIPTGVFIDES